MPTSDLSLFAGLETWKDGLLAILRVVMAIALIFLAANPAFEQRVALEQGNLVHVTDISGSTTTRDAGPDDNPETVSRFEAELAAHEEMLDIMPASIRNGWVLFNDAIVENVPLTSDRQTIAQAAQGLEPAGETAIGEGLLTGLRQCETFNAGLERGQEAPPCAVLLLSDGHWRGGRDPERVAVPLAQELGVPVYTVAFGREQEDVALQPDGALLQGIAADTGGRFFEATNLEELSQVYQDIAGHFGYEVQHEGIPEMLLGVIRGVLLLLGTYVGLRTLWGA